MLLYHFTSRANLPSILEHGLNQGEVPLSETRVMNAVNLTTDREPSGHGLDHGGKVVTEEESALFATKHGWNIPAGTVFTNKLEARITVKVHSSDRNLKRWQPWARKHCEPGFADQLAAAAGQGGRKARTWWLYFGTIPPANFLAVEDMGEEARPLVEC